MADFPSLPEPSLLALRPRLAETTPLPSAAAILLVAVATFAGTELSRRLWLAGGTFPTFWVPAGFYLAALLLSPRARWPRLVLAVGAGMLVSDAVVHRAPLGEALAFFGVNSVGALAGAVLLRRWQTGPFRVETLRAVWQFLGVTMVVSGLLVGPLAALLARLFWQGDFPTAWGHWTMANLAGLWLLTPPLLAIAHRHPTLINHWRPWRIFEAVLLCGSLWAISMDMFMGSFVFSLPSLLLMWAIWAALRFGAPGAGVAMLIIAMTSLFATVHGQGPFVRAERTAPENVIRLLIYLGVWSAFFQIVAAILSERALAEAALARLNQELEHRVTDRTRSLSLAGEALRASEERFRLAASAGGFGAYDYHLGSRLMHWTPEMKAIYGLAADAEIVGTEILAHHIHPEDQQRAQTAYLRALEPDGSGQFEIEHRIRTLSGSERWVRVSGRTMFEEQGGTRIAVRAIGTCTDVTERKQAEEALRESENRLALAVKAGQSGTFDWDIKADTNLWSDDLLALYGINAREFGGHLENWLESIHLEDRAAAQEAIQNSFQTGQFSHQFRIRRHDTSEVRWMEGRGTLLTDLEGRPSRLLGINVDITAQKQTEEALRESELRLKLVLESVNVGIWSVDLRSGALTVSPETRRAFGVPEGAELSTHEQVRARIHPEDRATEEAAAHAARHGQGQYEIEYRVLWPDGTVHWILTRGRLSRDREGRPRSMSGIALDITERKTVEQALKESEAKLRSYYEAAPLFMGVVELEADDIFHLYDNPASCRFFGVAAGATVARRASEFGMVRPAIELWLKYYRLSEERGEPVRFELPFPTSVGERWLSITVTPLAGGPAERRRFSYVAEDVTGRRRTETALRQHASRQATLLELTRTILARRAEAPELGVAIFQRVAGVLDADLGFNYRLHPDLGTLELVAGYGLPPIAREAAKHLNLDGSFCGVVAARATPLMADASCITSDPAAELLRSLGARAYACHPLLSSEGRVLGTLSFASTRRERFEPEEVSFLQTLSHYVAIAWERSAAEAAMTKAKEAAEEASRAKDSFLAALSHELRTPLNPVLLLASEMQRLPGLSPELQADIATIRRNVELEARLIDDLLDLTRITRGKVSLDLKPMGLHRVLQETLEILSGEVSEKALRVQLELMGGQPVVLADAVRLQQVFWNVLRNAIKFTPPAGMVTVCSREEPGGRVVVEVSDTGQGIAPEHLRVIFETFNQGAGGHRFGGLGLGLAIARSITEMHGGSIRAESPGPGLGATFLIELPLHVATEVSVGSAASPHDFIALAAGGEPSVWRILLVEDHEPTRAALTRLLERRGHTVTPAADLATARRFAGEASFDLLISDLGLPDGDGTELMRQFRTNGGPPGIALSGYGMEEDLQRSTEAGFFAHLVKPVDVDALDRTLARWSASGDQAIPQA